MLEDLSGSRYLMNAYGVSSDAWENFRQTGQKAALNDVAVSLCGAWTILAEDDSFFSALDQMGEELSAPDLQSALTQGAGTQGPGSDTPSDRGKFVADFAAHLDVDALLTRELSVLGQAGMEPVHVVRLISDLRDLLGNRVTGPGAEMMTSLQPRVKELADQLCKAQTALRVFDYDPVSEPEAGHAPHRRWVGLLRLQGKGVRATAGAAGAVANVAAAVASFGVATGFALASVLGGVEAMSYAIESVLALSPQPTDPPQAGVPPPPKSG